MLQSLHPWEFQYSPEIRLQIKMLKQHHTEENLRTGLINVEQLWHHFLTKGIANLIRMFHFIAKSNDSKVEKQRIDLGYI